MPGWGSSMDRTTKKPPHADEVQPHVYSPWTCQSGVSADRSYYAVVSHPSKKTFWFHYNRPASEKAGRVVCTVHYDGQTFDVDNVVCEVPIQGETRAIQPTFVMVGQASRMVIQLGVVRFS